MLFKARQNQLQFKNFFVLDIVEIYKKFMCISISLVGKNMPTRLSQLISQKLLTESVSYFQIFINTTCLLSTKIVFIVA